LTKIRGQKNSIYWLLLIEPPVCFILSFEVYEYKTAANAVDFLKACKAFYAFATTNILTDNGLEFTDRFVNNNKGVSGNHKFDKRGLNQ
jgi:hypothetical protein